jgi:hypothetical protein
VILLILAMMAALAAPQEPIVGKPEKFAAVLTAGPLSQTPLSLEIAINRWGRAADREALAAAFADGGQRRLMEALRKAGAAGYVVAPNRDRLVVGYVEQERRPDGGRRILLLCVRDGGSWEFTRDSGWEDHLFRVIALTLDPKDRGAGMLFHVAKVSVTKEKGVDLVSELTGQPTRMLSIQKIR